MAQLNFSVSYCYLQNISYPVPDAYDLYHRFGFVVGILAALLFGLIVSTQSVIAEERHETKGGEERHVTE